MRIPTPRTALVGGIAVAALALTGCAASDTPAESTGLSIVASTNVYGSIAESIGGDLVTVTSLITSAAQDPHSYEASAQDQLALSKADLVIENGGGYDPFIDTLLSAASTDAPVVNASEASGLLEADHDDATSSATEDEDHEGHDHIEGFNEHVWYSFHGVEHVAEEIAAQLAALDADNAATYEANYEAFAAQLEQLDADAEALHTTTEGLGVAITEPVPLYLLEAAGFTNQTPDEFSEAIEEGTDVAPAVLQETLGLFADGSVALLAYNEQTASSETEQVRAAAEDNDVPVVQFTETLPDGADYVSWMTDNLSAISAALG
ncbi:zinc/manganese transport system substrate-binding protein [Conyzicola lurida]|uniref:Zinc/manganese transport system substrate-binding protein n=1 Tax=Conyzicola lurida TaxID=1172621 RepID=A0A841ART5_9MICO|nr:zinc ABC transporter substrate-binding protein [Conyzicola lurida]MBB5844984.1 zinc/manganese transport system substrate-binding protein [Conyzicola lurida]